MGPNIQMYVLKCTVALMQEGHKKRKGIRNVAHKLRFCQEMAARKNIKSAANTAVQQLVYTAMKCGQI